MTPKTLDKYIAAVKKKAAAEGWSKLEYEIELNKLYDEMYDQYTSGKISYADMMGVQKKIVNAQNNQALQGKSAAPATPAQQGMSHDEYIGMWEALNKKKKAGLITQDEYSKLGDKLDKAYKDKKTAKEIEQEIGCDPGTLATDDSIIKLGKELKQVYGDASAEMQTKLDDFLKKAGPEMADLNQKLLDGTITAEEFDHLKMMTLQQKILGQKMDQLTGVMLNANQQAMAMINGETLHVFAENANYQSYQLSQDAKMDLMFSVYDEDTVENLIRNKPELIPRKEVKGVKDQAWNQKVIAGAVTQGVIQGDSIPKLAKRIATQTGETNMKAMNRYARTAMTSAQNAGRMEMLHRAKGMGIDVKKKWLATLDSRTRDSHQEMDGETADVDEDFKTPLGSHMKCPGDMAGKPGDVWNCRCTLIYEYGGYPNDPTMDQRIMYDEYYTTETDADGEEHKVFHRESRLITDMNYDEWKAAKTGGVLNDLDAAKSELAELQKQLVQKKVSETKVYKDLWKDPVTLADYPAKKAGIQAKKDYYDAEIDKYKQAQASGASWATDEKIKELEKKKKLLAEFEKNGELLEKRNNALKAVQGIYDKTGLQKTAEAPGVAKKVTAKRSKKQGEKQGEKLTEASGSPFGPEAYSKERKDKALWTTDKRKVDGIMRKKTGEMWRNATPEEREAIHEYTYTYKKFNEPLRGIEYGTSRYLGVGNTDLNAGSKRSGKKLNAITDLLDECSYDHDMWLNRGVRFSGMDKFFNVPMDLLQTGTESELRKALLGTTPTEYAFGSMGSAKGEGFSGDIIMNIYAPKGTKMLYAEPWSYYGHDKRGRLHEMDGANWDGQSTQPSYGTEFETILQQGTQFRVTKVERRGLGTIFVDLDVINQDNQQRWKP